MNPEIIAYCRKIDPALLDKIPFRKQVFPDVPNAWLAEQARLQKLAEKKLPGEWLEKNLLLPDRQAIEQSTSVVVANWKKEIIPARVRMLADASAGLGSDAFILSNGIPDLLLFETNPARAAALRYNATLLRSEITEVKNEGLSAAALSELLIEYDSGLLLYVDPDRRSDEGNRLRNRELFQPDVSFLYQIMKGSRASMLIKFSPLENPEELAFEMPGLTSAYIVSVHNEVKEVLLFWDFARESKIPEFIQTEIRHSGEIFSCTIPAELEGRPAKAEPEVGNFLLDPRAGLRKGRFAACLAEKEGWLELSDNARLYMSHSQPSEFPGRVFRISGVFHSLSDFRNNFSSGSCHVVARDFPASAEEIRKKLGFTEEGSFFLFCYRDIAGKRTFLLGERI